MKKSIRQYTPDTQTRSGGQTNNPGATGSTGSGNQNMTTTADSDNSDEHNQVGNAGDSDEDESGVDRRGKNTDTLTGTDNDETGPDETMATES